MEPTPVGSDNVYFVNLKPKNLPGNCLGCLGGSWVFISFFGVLGPGFTIIKGSYLALLSCAIHTAPPGFPDVKLNGITESGFVVSCTPGTVGSLPTSYTITVEPVGILTINTSDGSIGQNISELQPNTNYLVRVIAINCAGRSGEVMVNATTGEYMYMYVPDA